MTEISKTSKGLDILKVVLAIMITMLHLKPTSSLSEEITFSLTNAITRIGVPGFFFITGYLYRRSGTDFSDWDIVKRHIKRMIILYCAWTAMCMPMIINDFVVNPKYEGFSVLFKLVIFARRFMLIGSYTPLWFFLGGVYGTVFLFFLHKAGFSEKAIIMVLGICTFVIACLNDCYAPIGRMFFGSYQAMDAAMELMHHYIGHIWKEAIWGAFYMALGSWYATHRVKMIDTDFRRLISIIALTVGLVIEVLLMRRLGATNFSKMVTIIPIVMILVDFFAVKKFDKVTEGQSVCLRKVSTLIYGFHIVSSFYFNENRIPDSLFRYMVNMLVTISASACVIIFSRKKWGQFLKWLY